MNDHDNFHTLQPGINWYTNMTLSFTLPDLKNIFMNQMTKKSGMICSRDRYGRGGGRSLLISIGGLSDQAMNLVHCVRTEFIRSVGALKEL